MTRSIRARMVARASTIALLMLGAIMFGPAPSSGFVSDGAWSTPDDQPEREHHACIYDPIRDRFIAFAGNNSLGPSADVWAFEASTGSWSELHPTGDRPPAGSYYKAFYAPRTDEMIVIDSGHTPTEAKVWALSLGGSPVWREFLPTGGYAPTESDFGCAYDSVRHRLVTFGGTHYGFSATSVNSAWTFDLATSTWSLLPTTPAPPARSGALAVYDVARDWLVVHGGVTVYALTVHHDLWAYSFATQSWQNLDPSGPPYGGVTGRVMALDTRRSRICIIGEPAGSLWVPTPGTPWTWVATPLHETPSVSDGNRSVAYDSSRDRLLVLGNDGLHSLTLSDSTWQLIAPPARRSLRVTQPAVAFDRARNRMVAYGGVGSSRILAPVTLPLDDAAGWRGLDAMGEGPISGPGMLMLHDPLRDVALVDTGREQWSLSLDQAPLWAEIPMPGRPVFRHFGNSSDFGPFTESNGGIYDPQRDRVRFTTVRGLPSGLGANEVWSVSPSAPSAWTLEGHAIPRPNVLSTGHAVHDAEGDRLLCLVKSRFYDGNAYHDTLQVWGFPLGPDGSWTPISPPAPFPGDVVGQSMIYDPVRRRLVVYGGRHSGNTPIGLWELSLADPATWRLMTPAGPEPLPRAFHGCVYDPIQDRMVIFGGTGFGTVADTWFLTWGDTSAAIVGVPPDST